MLLSSGSRFPDAERSDPPAGSERAVKLALDHGFEPCPALTRQLRPAGGSRLQACCDDRRRDLRSRGPTPAVPVSSFPSASSRARIRSNSRSPPAADIDGVCRISRASTKMASRAPPPSKPARKEGFQGELTRQNECHQPSILARRSPGAPVFSLVWLSGTHRPRWKCFEDGAATGSFGEGRPYAAWCRCRGGVALATPPRRGRPRGKATQIWSTIRGRASSLSPTPHGPAQLTLLGRGRSLGRFRTSGAVLPARKLGENVNLQPQAPCLLHKPASGKPSANGIEHGYMRSLPMRVRPCHTENVVRDSRRP